MVGCCAISLLCVYCQTTDQNIHIASLCACIAETNLIMGKIFQQTLAFVVLNDDSYQFSEVWQTFALSLSLVV